MSGSAASLRQVSVRGVAALGDPLAAERSESHPWGARPGSGPGPAHRALVAGDPEPVPVRGPGPETHCIDGDAVVRPRSRQRTAGPDDLVHLLRAGHLDPHGNPVAGVALGKDPHPQQDRVGRRVTAADARGKDTRSLEGQPGLRRVRRRRARHAAGQGQRAQPRGGGQQRASVHGRTVRPEVERSAANGRPGDEASASAPPRSVPRGALRCWCDRARLVRAR